MKIFVKILKKKYHIELDKENPESDKIYLEILVKVSKYRGECYQALGENKKAIEDFTKFAELSPKNAKDTYYKLGILCEDLKNYNQAIEYYKKTIELAPKEPVISISEDLVKTLDDGNGASATVKDSTLIEGYEKNYRGRIGRIYFKQKKYAEALKYFDDALNNFAGFCFGNTTQESSYQGNNNVSWLRGQCNEHLKNYEAALKDYKDALEIDPKNKAISDAIKRMEQILNKK